MFASRIYKKIERNLNPLQVYRKCHGWERPAGKNTGITIYNCIEKQKVPLVLKDGPATWYSCGPTVYDSAHIGHACCYVKLDIIQRILSDYFNIHLITAMGVTDIDDKIIKKSLETKKDVKTITEMYEAEFWRNLSELGVALPLIITRVSQNIPTITGFIDVINKKGLSYKTADNSLYFDTHAYGKYGKLIKTTENEENESETSEKKSPSDFALWKGHKEGEPYWDSEWGNGRPGWHIECSAMVTKLFGNNVDFHAGGIDLKFPHHENEEAQSCAYHGNNQWVNYWIHTGHLHRNQDVKMSKSLKNTININEMLEKYSADVFRMACLLSHYRYSMEFTDEAMGNAKAIVHKIKYFLGESGAYVNDGFLVTVAEEENLFKIFNETRQSVDESLRDDFDTPKSIKCLMKLMKETQVAMKSKNTENLTENSIVIVLIRQYVKELFFKFGCFREEISQRNTSGHKDIIDALIQFRQAVRLQALKQKNTDVLKECDNIRNTLKSLKVKINDMANDKALWIFED